MDDVTPPPPPQQYPQQPYPPQGYPQQPSAYQGPSFHQPPPPQAGGSNAGKIIGGVVAAALVCASVGVGFLKGQRMSRAFGGQGSSPVSRSQRSSAASTVMTLNSQIQLYRLQHNDTLPDFNRYPNWEQLSQYSDSTGRLSRTKTARAYFGPYIHSAPVNPSNDLSNVTTVMNVQAGMTVPGGRKVGYVMDGMTGRIFMTDRSGQRVAVPDGY